MKKRILVVGLVLTLVAVLVMPMAVLAANPATDTTLVSGEIPYEYTITAPDDINLGTFDTAGDYEATGRSISVSTNDAEMTMCGITVNDIKTNTKGYLTLDGADAVATTKLTNPLKVTGGAQPSYTPLTITEVSLRAGNTSPATAIIADFGVKQTIAADDLSKAAGTYKMIMTFTATFS